MNRFVAIWLTVALILAPCAVVHAAHSQASDTASNTSDPSRLHDQGNAKTHLSGAAHHSHAQGHEHHPGGDSPDNHDCVMNCQGWLSSSSSSVALDRAGVSNNNNDPVALLFAAQERYRLVRAGSGDPDPPPRDHASIPEPISIIDLSGRRRI